jgi:glutathione synthase/RimK-type ligase-like ATP-grasp enzyme
LKEGELALAREHFEKALRAEPGLAEAHQGLANLFLELDDEERAEWHFRMGFRTRSVNVLPYRGRAEPIPVLVLVSAKPGNIPILPYLDDQIYLVTVIVAEFYDPSLPLPPHRLMINAIGDADLCGPALEAAVKLTARTQAPVLNNPAAVMKTGRIANAGRLRQVSGVVTPKMVNLPRAALAKPGALAALAARGLACPFLLRTPGFHNGQNFLRIENAGDLKAALEALPGRQLTALQYLDARSPDGKIRKYRVMLIDGKIYPLHAAIAHHWKVHYVTAEMAGRPEHLAEEEAFLNAMPEVLGERAMKALEDVRDALALDYAGIDFSLSENGEILLFEANATMVVIPPERDDCWAYRRAPIDRIQRAIRAMLAEKAAGSRCTIPSGKAA